ncbi:MAG: hypothetical protein IKS37_01310 [Solobacterium sp.]|nr:hypothetical protein [Solobacterium sp.]
MTEVRLRDFSLTCPEGFKNLDEADRAGFQMTEAEEGFVFSNPERHMMISCGWKKAGGLLGALTDTDGLAKDTEKKLGKAMKPYGYSLAGFSDRKIAGEYAEAFRYTYTAQDVPMTAETVVIKYEKALYNFHLYARTALLEDSLPVWEEFLASIHK